MKAEKFYAPEVSSTIRKLLLSRQCFVCHILYIKGEPSCERTDTVMYYIFGKTRTVEGFYLYSLRGALYIYRMPERRRLGFYRFVRFVRELFKPAIKWLNIFRKIFRQMKEKSLGLFVIKLSHKSSFVYNVKSVLILWWSFWSPFLTFILHNQKFWHCKVKIRTLCHIFGYTNIFKKSAFIKNSIIFLAGPGIFQLHLFCHLIFCVFRTQIEMKLIINKKIFSKHWTSEHY